MKLAAYLHFAQHTAQQAGRLLRRLVSHSVKIKYKSSRINLVTIADKRSEALIIKAIRSKYPQHQILSEETGLRGNPHSEFQWLVDPLDGTTNFAHQFPFYAVSIALIYNSQAVVGVVYIPSLNEMFCAVKNNGAYLNRQRIKISKIPKMIRSLLTTGFPYTIHEKTGRNFKDFQKMSLSAQAVRRIGSAAIDLCYVACGRFDGFWERGLNPWDVAAGSLILTEAGGKITDFKGKPYDIYQPKKTLATNGKIHRQMIKVLAKL